MKRYLLVSACLILLAAGAGAQTYTAVLTGPEEVPVPGDPDGVGVAFFIFSGTTLRYSVVFQNINPPTAAHIHTGVAGEPGPVLIGFEVATLSNGVVQNVPQSTIDAIAANPGGYYINVHNADYPGGAIRGQLVPFFNTVPGPQFVPVVGKITGAAGTNFVTDVRIVNRGSAPAEVTLDFFQQGAVAATRTITVAGGEQRTLDDLIGFLGASGLGSLRVTSRGNIDVLARVLNDLRSSDQGTSGFAVEAGELTDAALSGSLGFLSTSSVADINARVGFRTNIGYFNPTGRSVTGTFRAHRPDGTVIGTTTVTIPAFSFAQRGAFELITGVPAADQVQPNFYVTWTAAGGPLFVYGAVVDNRTGDSVLVQ